MDHRKKNQKSKIKNQKYAKGGYALIVAILVMSIMSVTAVALSGIIMGNLKISKELDDATIAFYAAESGIEENLYNTATSLPCKTSDVLTNSARWIATCGSNSGCGNLLQATGQYHSSRMALEVCVP